MSGRTWQSEAPLACLHSEQAPRAQSAQDAAETFCACLERHILPDAITELSSEELSLNSIKERIANARAIEMEKLQLINDRFRRITEIVQGAQDALNPLCNTEAEGDPSVAPTELHSSDGNTNGVQDASNEADGGEKGE